MRRSEAARRSPRRRSTSVVGSSGAVGSSSLTSSLCGISAAGENGPVSGRASAVELRYNIAVPHHGEGEGGPAPMPKLSAGLLVYKFAEDGSLAVLLVHPGGPFWKNKDVHAWSIPKGEYQDGEDPEQAAELELRTDAEDLRLPSAERELEEVQAALREFRVALAVLWPLSIFKTSSKAAMASSAIFLLSAVSPPGTYCCAYAVARYKRALSRDGSRRTASLKCIMAGWNCALR